MKYERFEDLPVWKDAIKLVESIYRITRDPFFRQPGDLCDQLRRAALSISNNVAEGFERGSTAELLAFIYIARGSAGEVRSMLHFASRLAESEALKSEFSKLILLAESCSRQLRAWADSLQNSEIRGQRHLNDKSRRQFDSDRRAEAFKEKISEMMRQHRPQDFPPPPTDDS